MTELDKFALSSHSRFTNVSASIMGSPTIRSWKLRRRRSLNCAGALNSCRKSQKKHRVCAFF
jgi:hypothetical protein